MANVLICPKCGQELNDNSRYCSYCGHCLSFKDNQIDNRNNANNTNVYAIIGFVLSLAGDLLITIGGLVLSAIGLKKANIEGYELKGLSLAGLIIASIKIAILLTVTIIYFLYFWSIISYKISI